MAPGERAHCARCDAVLAKGSRFGPETALAFAATGLILAVPAAILPFVTAGKLRNERISHLFTGVAGLWDNNMPELAILVLLCGGVFPIALLCCLAALLGPARFGRAEMKAGWLLRVVRVLGHWAIPEVQVLAVLVALMKLGKLVDVKIGPGFWFYGAMSLALLFAMRSFELEASP